MTTTEEYRDLGATAEQAERWAEDQQCTVKDCRLCPEHCQGGRSLDDKCQTSGCPWAAGDVPMFAITLPFAAFQTALRNVHTAAASTDDTLPSLCGVLLDCAADGTLTFTATDRYVLAMQDLTPAQACEGSGTAPANPPCQGSGSVLLAKATVRDLLAVKPAKGYSARYELITLTATPGSALTVAYPDTRVITYPSSDAEAAQFPRTKRLAEGFTTCAEGSAPVTVKYNPAHLARFAKIAGRNSHMGITVTPVTGASADKGAVASRIECGDLTAYVIHIRLGN